MRFTVVLIPNDRSLPSQLRDFEDDTHAADWAREQSGTHSTLLIMTSEHNVWVLTS